MGAASSISARIRQTSLLRDLPREVAVLSTVAFFVALGFGIVAPAIPLFAKSFGVTVFQASAVISVFAFFRLISATPAGLLVNRFGERRVLATGLGIVAVSSALAGLATDYIHLLVLRGIGGLGSAMFTVSAMALLLRVVEPEQRGRASAAYQGGFLLGGVAGPAVGGLVLGISIRAPFFVYSATLTAATIVTITMLSKAHLRDREEAAGIKGSKDEPGSLRRALGDRAYLTALTINLGNGFASFGLRSALIPLFVVEALALGRQWTGYGLLVSAIIQGVLLLPAGRMADTRGRKPALILGTAATTIGFVVLSLTHSLGMFLLSMAILGAGAAYLASAPAAVVGDMTGGKRGGPIVSTYQMMSDVGAVAAPLIAGKIVDSTGSFAVGFLVGAAILGIGFLMSLFIRETLATRTSSQPEAEMIPNMNGQGIDPDESPVHIA